MNIATLLELDSSVYPQVWEQRTFNDPQTLLMALLLGHLTLDPNAFTKQLQANDVYQEWINASIFGRYIQRSFAALYHQSEDSFNMDIPALFLNELKRHGQYLPINQILFVAGDIPKKARQDKIFTTTLNPATVLVEAQKPKHNIYKSVAVSDRQLIVNQIRVVSKQVLGFPIRHNKRTSERTRNEVLILGFNDLRLVDEQDVSDKIMNQKRDNTAMLETTAVLLRCYELR